MFDALNHIARNSGTFCKRGYAELTLDARDADELTQYGNRLPPMTGIGANYRCALCARHG
jgi:hypothetical protein